MKAASPRRMLAGAVLLGMVAWLFTHNASHVATATFVDAQSVAGNVFVSDAIQAPTNLSATGGGSVHLSWTATTSGYAGGYRVLRGTSSGGPYSLIGTVTPRTSTGYSDSPGIGTFYYVVLSSYQNWESPVSNEDSCTGAALVFIC